MPIIDYEYKSKVALDRLLNDPKITQKNKSDLRRFLNSREISPARVGIIARHILLLYQEMPDVVGCMEDRDLVNDVFKRLKNKCKPGYFETVKNVGKSYVRWFNDGETPKGWRDIKGQAKKMQKRDLRPEDMLTWQDGLRLIEYTNSVQLKALVMVQLDAGFRPSEIVDLNYGDVLKDGECFILHVTGKTGARDVLIKEASPYLHDWLTNHPVKQKNSPLWIIETPGNSHKKEKVLRYDYYAILKRVRKLGELAGLGAKPFDFYSLRHSNAVIRKIRGQPVDIAAQQMGHTVEYFAEVYGRLSPADVKQRLYGKPSDKVEEKINPRECPFCGYVNKVESTECARCFKPITREGILARDRSQEERLKQLEAQLSDFGGLVKAMAKQLGTPNLRIVPMSKEEIQNLRETGKIE